MWKYAEDDEDCGRAFDPAEFRATPLWFSKKGVGMTAVSTALQNDIVWHNDEIRTRTRESYLIEGVDSIARFLEDRGTFEFPTTERGLFPASIVDAGTKYTQYDRVWIRDNVFVAYAHWLIGKFDVAAQAMKVLMEFMLKQRGRFEAIISEPKLADDPMKRPHVRLNGSGGGEEDRWAHAQNDALGYFLWLYCKLARDGHVPLGDAEIEMLALFPKYFKAIQYWKDRDSGHWEETAKVSASSIGVVVAALREYQRLVECWLDAKKIGPTCLDERICCCGQLIRRGEVALNGILPSECVDRNRIRRRRYDAALLFLVFPMEVVEDRVAVQIVADVRRRLQGPYGIRRYIRDSYWCTNYKQKVSPELRTVDYSENIGERDCLFEGGREAQWCIFDPVISAIFGRRYQQTRKKEYLALQVQYLNRSLGQITGEDSEFGPFKCPELYYMEDGNVVTSDATPLLWTQANLLIALKVMRDSLQPRLPR